MFFLVPISHDSMTARRLPWVTIVIIALNLCVHVALLLTTNTTDVELAAQRAIEFHQKHPHLTAPRPLDAIERELGVVPHPTPQPGADQPDDGDSAADQEQLDELTRALADSLGRSPTLAYGYVPARMNLLGLVTSQFLHGGWLHLIFNLWFLWLVGCYVEDVWGRLVFPAFYLTAGAVAAIAHHLAEPASAVPLIGASGAVAGAMGAFLVRYARTNISFWYLVWLAFRFRTGTFQAPAFVMLPLWLASQLAWALLGAQDGVAYWAHVGGFTFGLLVAFAMRATGQERKLDHTIENRITVAQDPQLLAASAQIDRGEYDAALLVLARLADEQPYKVEVHLERLRAAKGKRDEKLEARAYADAIRAYAQQMPDTAADLLDEASREGRAGSVPRETRLRIGRQLAHSGATERAVSILASLYAGGAADLPGFQALLAHAELALNANDNVTAARLFEMASVAPHPHPELDAYLEQKLRQARGSARPRASGPP